MSPILPLLLTGCYREVRMYDCESESFEVADDELAGDLTVSADDLLAVIGGVFAFDALDEGGGAASGEVEVVRGAGPAIATEITVIERVVRGGLGFGEEQTTSRVLCQDTLDVPVDVALATDDGALALSLAGIAVPHWTRPGHEPERFEVNGDVDPAEVGATASDVAGLSLEWTAEGLDYVSLWKRGDDRVEWILETY